MYSYQFSEDLLLTTKTGKYLYEEYAKNLPIIDYHCHLLAEEIYEDKVFEDLGELWLKHDHYKWRAMRTFGIAEDLITGSASFEDKFMAFAKIFPKLIGNPLYIWCGLELKRYFGIDEPLSCHNAKKIYDRTKEAILEKQMRPSYFFNVSNVELISTTEDPIDSLLHHEKLQQGKGETTVLTAFRPDHAFYLERDFFSEYLTSLGKAAEVVIASFEDLLKALEKRLLYFKDTGTVISDHGIDEFQWELYTNEEINEIFDKALEGKTLSRKEIFQYRSAFLVEIGKLYHKHGFIMQLHVGTYLGANKRKEKSIGFATGFDCTDDGTSVKCIGQLLDALTTMGTLPKMILYPLDPSQIDTYAVLAAGFCDEGVRGKVQLGAPWWFNDTAYGLTRHFEASASLYPISLSVGMLTDSRSFLSYIRHELYRRSLCNYFGCLIERGEYFSPLEELKEIIEDICYYNIKEFLGLKVR